MTFFMIIDEDHNVWVFGANNSGNLGLGDKTNRHVPVKIIGLPPIVSVTSGFGFSLFLDIEGSVWFSGEIFERHIKTTVPIKLGNVQNIVKISASAYQFLLLDSFGEVFILGFDGNGILFDNDDDKKKEILTKIENMPKIEKIYCESFNSILIDVDGNCWGFGYNYGGNLGFHDKKHRHVPTKLLNTVDRSDTKFLPSIQAVGMESFHTILLGTNDDVYSCGRNNHGELGLGHLYNMDSFYQIRKVPKIKSVYCGYRHTFLIDIDNNIWSFGCNEDGQLALGHLNNVSVPTKVPFEYGTVSSIICTNDSTIIINTEGCCFSCGDNKFGQLGLGHTDNVNVPTIIPGLNARVRRSNRTKSARN